jgi:hypothetical protein
MQHVRVAAGLPHAEGTSLLNARFVNPRDPLARALWLECFLPYFVWNFCVMPALFLPLGKWAALSVLINKLVAELLTNLHGFLTIVPNHAGDDLYQFAGPIDERE